MLEGARRSRRVARSTAVLCVAFVTAPAGAAADGSPSTTTAAANPGTNGRIVWAAGPPSASDIWAMDPGGVNAQRLTDAPAEHDHPAVSPDGTQIAYERGTEVWLMGSNGGNPHRVSAPGAHRTDPTWSPDGERIAWTDGSSVFVYSTETQQETVLKGPDQVSSGGCERTVGYGRPRWSPRGGQLVAVRYTDPPPGGCIASEPQRDLVLLSIPGGNVTVLTDDAPLDEFPDWHPAGTALVFQRGTAATGFFGLSRIEPAAGAEPTALAPGFGAQPRFSPDGKKILFVRDGNSDGRFDLWTMSPTGTDARKLLEDDRSNRAPDWGTGGCGSPQETFCVGDNGDGPDADPGDGVCATNEGACTLRAALQEANALDGRQTIEFHIAESGVPALAPQSELPPATGPVRIDGTTQSAKAVRIVGGSAGTGADGLTIAGGRSTVTGLQIGGFDGAGIRIDGNGGSTIRGNNLGAEQEPGGEGLDGNRYGVVVTSSANNVIGGEQAGQANAISSEVPPPLPSGLLQRGVQVLVGSGAHGTTIVRNVMGQSPLGVVVAPGSSNTTVDSNVMLHHHLVGVLVVGSDDNPPSGVSVSGNLVAGNETTNQGKRSAAGVIVTGSANDVQIGTGNRISGNGVGILVHGSRGVVVKGNTLSDMNDPNDGPDAPSRYPPNLLAIAAWEASQLGIGTASARNVIFGGYGILVRGGSGVTIGAGSTTGGVGATTPGILASGTSNLTIGTKKRSFAMRQSPVGSWIQGSRDVELRNVIASGGALGIAIESSRGVTLDDLDVRRNDLGISLASGKIEGDSRWPAASVAAALAAAEQIEGSTEVQAALQVARLFDRERTPPAGEAGITSDVTMTASVVNENGTGVFVEALAERIVLGGGEDAASNAIRGNTHTGVAISGPGSFESADRIRLLNNTIRDSGEINVDVGAPGPTPFGRPVLSNPKLKDRDTVSAAVALTARPNTEYRIDFYSATACGPGGQGNAGFLRKTIERRTNENGVFEGRVDLLRGVFYAALATPLAADAGSSGELSPCFDT